MAIRTVITRGYGNGTFNGTIALVVPRGYISSDAVAVVAVVSPRLIGRSTLDLSSTGLKRGIGR